MEVSPPGGVLVRRAPGTAAFDFGQRIPLSTCWLGAAGGRAGSQRSPLQPGARPAAGSAAGAAGMQHQQLVLHSESMAWACNLPNPTAAFENLQRAALLAKAAGPAGPLVQQQGENFATVLPCGFW